MAKTRRYKYDLWTLCTKNLIIGSSLVLENKDLENEEEILEILDWYGDYRTDEIHIDFVGGKEGSFNLRDKYIVEIEDSYKSISSKKKGRKKK